MGCYDSLIGILFKFYLVKIAMFKLEPGEKIVLKVRRHKLGLIFQSMFLALFIILPPFLFWISERTVVIKGNDFALFTGVYSLVLLIAWMMFFVIWTSYYLDVLIITDKRVVDIDQKGFFSREVATLSLDKIQDITTTVSGILATFMDFGTVKIQTAGESKEFIIRDVPEPAKIKSIVYGLQHGQIVPPEPTL